MTTNNPRHMSETNEHFTPQPVIDAARKTLGVISMDPASTRRSNARRVQAEVYYSAEENGFTRQWGGHVFLNPPGGNCDGDGVSVTRIDKKWSCDPVSPCHHIHSFVHSSQKAWWQKLVHEWEEGRVTSAIFVGFSIEILQTSQVKSTGTLPLEFPMCVPSRRLAYSKEVACTGQCQPQDVASCVSEEDLQPIVTHSASCDGVQYVVGSSPPHASVLIFLPPLDNDSLVRMGNTQSIGTIDAIQRFVEAFSPIGHVMVPWRWR